MGSPAIFSGAFTKLLTSRGLLTSSGRTVDYDGISNFIENGHFEVNTNGWSTYADAVAATPVDGTGGSPTVTLARSTSTPLSGLAHGLITKDAANRQGEGISYDFSVDNGLSRSLLEINFDLSASANFVIGDSSDIQVYIYDATNASLITPTKTYISSSTGTFRSSFIASGSTSYRLILHIATTNANAWTFQLDNVRIGATNAVSSTIVTDWQSFTMTIGADVTAPTKATSPVIDEARWRRVGDSMEIFYQYKHTNNTGASSGSGRYLYSLPNGYSIDTTKLTTNSNTAQVDTTLPTVGYSQLSDDSSNSSGGVTAHNSTQLRITAFKSSGDAPFQASTQFPLGSSTIGISFFARVPISGWGTGSTLVVEPPMNDWQSFTMTIGATTTPPTKANTPLIDEAKWRRDGDSMEIVYQYAHTDSTGAAAGSGAYLYSLPSGYLVDTNKLTTNSGTANKDTAYPIVGHAGFANASNGQPGSVISHNTTQFKLTTWGDATSTAFQSNSSQSLGQTTVAFSFYARVPIVGWASNFAIVTGVEAPNSEVYVDTGNGHGSTNTVIRRFSNIRNDVGSDITYTDSSTNGASFTINTTGLYAINYSDYDASASEFVGISVNGSALTTSIATVTYAQGKRAITSTGGANIRQNVACTLRLSVGDIIRAHTNGNPDGTDDTVIFQIIKVSI